MADLPLLTATAALQVVPAIIVLTQTTDHTVRVLAPIHLALALWIGLFHHINFVRDLTNGPLLQVLAIAAAVLAIVVAVRHKQQVLGTLMITGGGLMALRALGILG